MAEPKAVQWTVVIAVEEDECLTGTYKLSPNIRLVELSQIWKEDFDLIGHWVFPSANEDEMYYDEQMTLEKIGESVPRMVLLKAELSDEPAPVSTREIYVYLKNKCHHLLVKPYDKLSKVVWRLPERARYLQYNGVPLNLQDTVQQAGIQNQSVIYESLFSINVKLSTGGTVVIQLSSEDLVLHLKEKVHFYEMDEFSLWYQGRYLMPEESIVQIKHVVEVTRAEFVVSVLGQHVNWTTKDEPIPVSEFISRLGVEGNIDTQKLETVEFACVGCQRRIRQSEDDSQKLPIDCCKERSLTLTAMTPEIGTNPEINDSIKILHEHLVQCRVKGSRSITSRCLCREMKIKLAEERLDYNVLTQCSDSLLRRISQLEEKINKMELILEKLKIRNVELEEENEIFQATQTKDIKKVGILDKENEEFKDEQIWDSKINRPLHVTANSPARLPALPRDELGVKLLVIYYPIFFSPTSGPEVQQRGELPRGTSASYIACQIPGIRTGSVPFEELSVVLQRFFIGSEICEMLQCRGSVKGRTVAMITVGDQNQIENRDQSTYCDSDGKEHSWEDAGEPGWKHIRFGDSIFICGAQKRTVLWIWI